MRNLSHNIEQYILGRFQDETENYVRLRRKDLAEMFECVPSQINYVLRSRFSPEQGYIIESRRGEHGYIKIVRISCVTPEQQVEHTEDLIGDTISLQEASRLMEYLESRELITPRERLLCEIALRYSYLSWDDLSIPKRERMLADMLKRIMKGLMLLKEEKRQYNRKQ